MLGQRLEVHYSHEVLGFKPLISIFAAASRQHSLRVRYLPDLYPFFYARATFYVPTRISPDTGRIRGSLGRRAKNRWPTTYLSSRLYPQPVGRKVPQYIAVAIHTPQTSPEAIPATMNGPFIHILAVTLGSTNKF